MTFPDHRGVAGLALVLALLAWGRVEAADPVEFNRDIRPILAENCFSCHGPDKATRKSGLRLDDRPSALTKGAIVPGRPEESELVARVLAADPDEVMPPPASMKPLVPAQKDLLRRWVAEGARYQAHWAYEPIRHPTPPPVRPGGWARGAIDAFILANLDAKGITPAPEAARGTLLRRLSLDLVGLPPTAQELKAFEDDRDASADERVVDRLLASPHFGERMAVPWLDLVRFADSVGYHGDQNQNIFPYRDYVIDAFNRDLPFDRFTAEQLAGDLLPNPTSDQLVASGFNRLNMMTREGGAQPREYLAKYASDRVRTVSITWLGSTLGCAECHDHKYDPFTARDFYRLAAFFADVQQWGVYMDYGYTPNPDLKGFSNDHPFPPEVEVESPYLKRRIARLDREIGEVLAASAARIPAGTEFASWVAAARAILDRDPAGWVTPPSSTEPPGGSGGSGGITLRDDGSWLLSGNARPKEQRKIRVDLDPGWLASIRVEALPRPEHGGRITQAGAASATITVAATLEAGPDHRPTRLTFARADADAKDDRFVNGSAVVGVKTTWKTASAKVNSRQAATWVLDRPVRVAAGDRLVLALRLDDAGCVRISTTPFGFEDPRRAVVDAELATALRADPGARSAAQAARIGAAYLLGTGWDAPALSRLQTLVNDRANCREGRARSLVTRAREPLPTRVLPRGNWQDETGDVVAPGFPRFLPQGPEPAEPGRTLNRLDLARWLTSADNPLTARVFVNRTWKQFFGAGLAAVMEDVGAQGEWPSHPDLLDWLAADFRDHGWNIKRLVKQMVLSAAYRQDSRGRPELREADPLNRWLAAQSPRRLEAEFVRDNALAIAGLLDPEVGGPSAFPYQPPGYYANIQFPDRDYFADRDDRQYRRGVYIHRQRTFPHPMLTNFDAPSREECTASRPAANTPQQALTLLNDPTFVEASRVLAGHLLAEAASSTDADRLDRLFRRALSRPARDAESRSLLAFLARQRAETQAHPDEARKLVRVGLAPVPENLVPAELAAWTEVCRVVLNLHETITRY